MDAKTAHELHLEDQAIGLGQRRYFKDKTMPWRDDLSTTTDEADTRPGHELTHRTLAPLEAAIEAVIEKATAGRAGRKSTAALYLAHLPPKAVAYLTAKAVISAAAARKGLVSVAASLGGVLEDQFLWQSMWEEAPEMAKAAERRAKSKGTPRHRRDMLRRLVAETKVSGLEWSKTDKVAVGTKLVELFEEVTGLVEIARVAGAGNAHTSYIVAFTEAATEWLARMHDRCALLSPLHLPMVVPPRDWTTPTDGGYLNQDALRLRLVRTRSRGGLEPFTEVEMPEVYDAVNAIQRTAWRVNSPVLRVLEELWASGRGEAGLPARDDVPVPEKPVWVTEGMARADMTPPQLEEFMAWKRRAAEKHQENGKLRGARWETAQKLWVAREFCEDDEIYFPHTLDFRGRVYPVPALLNPQGDDMAKGLLQFAWGRPLGENGWFWLAVHIANLWGVDKCSFEERAAWTLANSDQLVDSGENPLDGERCWMTADDGANPWQALAACIEWAGFQRQGSEWVSHLPIHMDGSCSGLQHLSALLRDPQGGSAVNLTPAGKPADVYSRVAEKVSARLEVSAGGGDEMAKAWLGWVSRAVVKRPCMTYAYSVTSRGIRDQILDQLRKDHPTGEAVSGQDYFAAATYLAPIVEKCIRETVIAAAGAMDYLKETARIAAKADIPLRWETPVGFPVVQDYRATAGKRVKVYYNGLCVKLNVREEQERLDSRRMGAGAAPNYVHSLDAAHLMRTVLACRDAGIESVAVIHDSFGTHAADIDDLHRLIRETFVEMYKPDLLSVFAQQTCIRMPEAELPERPPMGTLDLAEVLDSDFFFS